MRASRDMRVGNTADGQPQRRLAEAHTFDWVKSSTDIPEMRNETWNSVVDATTGLLAHAEWSGIHRGHEEDDDNGRHSPVVAHLDIYHKSSKYET